MLKIGGQTKPTNKLGMQDVTALDTPSSEAPLFDLLIPHQSQTVLSYSML